MGLTPRQRLLRSAFSRLRVFPVLGWGGQELWQRFMGIPGVLPAQAARDSDLFVLAGEIPSQWQERLLAVLEGMALPRAVIWLRPAWRCDPPAGLPLGHTVSPSRIESLRLSSLATELLDRGLEVPEDFLEDRPPSPPWQDAAASDTLVLGPHFPFLPSGLQLELRMEGERVSSCEGVHNAFPLTSLAGADPVKIGPGNLPALKLIQGLHTTVSALESSRWYSHISWMADFLMLAGLPGAAAQLRPLRRLPDRTAFTRVIGQVEPRLRPLCKGVGGISAATVRSLGLPGPVARASGVPVDARSDDSAYLSVGFEPVLERDGDAWARWRQRVRECLQSLDLIARARQCPTTVSEAPRGAFSYSGSVFVPPTTLLFPLLQRRLCGMEWSQAVLFIASLDLCPQEAALQ